MIRRAVLSQDGLYRYALTREWDQQRPAVLFVMLNPSTADATRDDPTIRRCVGFACAWGFGSLLVANINPWRTPSPKNLPPTLSPASEIENDYQIGVLIDRAAMVVVAWGAHGRRRPIPASVARLMAEGAAYTLGLNNDGTPRHPLYRPAAIPPTSYPGRFDE